MKQVIQNKIDELKIKLDDLKLEELNQAITDKQFELNTLLMQRSETQKTADEYIKEIDFLEKMIMKLEELQEKENE